MNQIYSMSKNTQQNNGRILANRLANVFGLVLGIVILNSNFSFAESNSITLTKSQVLKINPKTLYFVDTTNKLDIGAIINTAQPWATPDSDNMIFDLERTTVWSKIILNNPSNEAIEANIEFNPVFLEYITVFDSQGRQLHQIGSRVPSQNWHSFPTLRLLVPPGTHQYYASTNSRANSLSLTLRSNDAQEAKSFLDISIFSALIGGLSALLLYHIFLFLTYRNRNYFLYSLFLASSILFTVSFTAYHVHLLPPKIAGFSVDFWWSAVSASLLFLSLYLFSADLLGVFPHSTKWVRGNRRNLLLTILPMTHLTCIIAVFITDSPFLLIPIRFGALLEILTLTTVAMNLWLKNRSNTIALYYVFSWIPFFVGAILIVASLSGAMNHHDAYSWSLSLGVLMQSILLSFAAGQRLNTVTSDKLSEQQAKLRVMDQLEVQLKNLEKRDRVITAFATSEIVDELDRGADPMLYTPRNVEKSIVFLDMQDFTSFSEEHSALECHEVLNEYFQIINSSTYEGGGRVDKIIGDAMMMVYDNPKECLRSVVSLRRNLSAQNKRRVSNQQKPIKFGTGVSFGTMLSANFGSTHKFDRTLVGDVVNVASRLENITRTFNVDVLCSREFIELHSGYEYQRPAGYVLLKGRQKKSLVYELFEHNSPEVINWKISTKTHIEEVVDLELNEKYTSALAILHELISKCPKHSFKQGMIMDPTLESMVKAIEDKMRQLGKSIPASIPASNPNLRKAA